MQGNTQTMIKQMIRCATSCVILVGGFSRPVGTLAANRGPLVEEGGRPFLDVLIGEASRRGFSQILLLAGERAAGVVEYAKGLACAKTFPTDVNVAVAPEALGSAGAIAHVADRLDDEFPARRRIMVPFQLARSSARGSETVGNQDYRWHCGAKRVWAAMRRSIFVMAVSERSGQKPSSSKTCSVPARILGKLKRF
jgi:hypothetical protein